MSERLQFDYEQFLRFSGLELCRYLDPILANLRRVNIPREVIDQLLSDLPTFDDQYHLVYALELLFHFAPEAVIQHVPRYLAHPEGSVWCAAHRIIVSWARPEHLTPELISAVREMSRSNPDNKYVQYTWKELKQRVGAVED